MSTFRRTRRSAADTGVLTNLGGGLVVQAIGVVTGTLLARGLGPHDRGVIAAMVLWPMLVVAVGDCGIGSALAFFPARQPGAARRYFRFAERAAVAVSLVLTPVGLLVTYFGLKEASVTSIPLGLVLTSALIPTLLFSRYIAALAQGLLRFGIVYAVRISMVLPIAVVLVIELLVGQMSVRSVVAAYVAGLVATTLVSLGVKRLLVRGERDGEIAPVRRLMSYGLRSLFGALYPVETLLVDQMIVALSLGPHELGLYVVAVAFTTLPRVVADAIGTAALPHIARAADPGRPAIRFLGIGAVVLVPTGIALTVVMPWLLVVIFGPKFSGAIVPAQLLIWSSILFGFRRIAGDAIRGLGVPGRASAIELASWPVMIGVLGVAARGGLVSVAEALVGVQLVTLFASLIVLGHALRRAGPTSELEVGARSDASTAVGGATGPW